MRRLILALMALIIAPISVTAEPQRIDDIKPPCDNSKTTDIPPCETDSEGVENPTAVPNDPVIVPPDIPAEGLPNQDKEPSSDESPADTQNR